MFTVAKNVTIKPLTEPAELFHQYPGKFSPQPCYLTLNLTDGELTADWDAEVGEGRPMSVVHRRTLRWWIPCLTADAANRLMTEAEPFARRILAGASIDYDGNSWVGSLNADADAAEDELTALREHDYAGDEADTVQTVTAADWYAEGEDPAAALSITADTTDAELDDIITRERADIEGSAAPGVLVVEGLDEYLTGVRDEQRQEVRETLTKAFVELDKARARRDLLIVQVKGWGVGTDTNRSVGELAGISHTHVGRIVELAKERAASWGTLFDSNSDDAIGPATREQWEASMAAGETGVFLIDRTGDPCDPSADVAVFGPMRTVYVVGPAGAIG